LIDELLIFIIKSVRIYKHFLEVKHVLLQAISHLLDLYQLMPIMLVKHTLHANCHTALLAEIFDRFVGVAWAENVGLTSLDSIGKEKHLWRHHILASLKDSYDFLVFDEFSWICSFYRSLASRTYLFLLCK
jgi:hypothetical protein